VNCPVCHNDRSKVHLEAAGHVLLQCASCDLVWLRNAPTRAQSKAWFEHEFVNDNAFLVEKYIDYRLRAIQRIAAVVSASIVGAGPQRLLDVGTASGSFVEVMGRVPGVAVEGLEPSLFAADATSKRLGVRVHTGFIEDQSFPEGSFDIVTCLDTLCLVSDPHVDVAGFARLLKPGGRCFIELPGFHYRFIKGSGWVGRALYGGKLGLQLGLHTLYFRRGNLVRLFEGHGLRIRSATPIEGPMYGSRFKQGAQRIGFALLDKLYRASARQLELAPKILYEFEKSA